MNEQGWFVPRRPVPPQAPPGEAPVQDEYAHGESYEDAYGDASIRPFIVTGGRTSPLADGLRLETLVRALPAALSAPLAFEPRRVVELCQRPCSVAEIAAALGVPLGVARVVVGDLLAGNLVFCHETPAADSMPVHTVERIRDLVRAL